MSNLKQLQALGAECVGGSIIWKRQVLGVLRDGDFHITDAGREALKVVDVEARPVGEQAPALEDKERSTRRRPRPLSDVDDVEVKV